MMDTTPKARKKPIPTVVVSRPGIMQQSLRVVVTNCQEINVVDYAGDGLSAMLQVRQHQPGLLVIDHNLLEEEVQALLLVVKEEHPATQCLAITSSKRQEAHLIAWGADIVLLRNAPPQEMQAALLRLAHEASLLCE